MKIFKLGAFLTTIFFSLVASAMDGEAIHVLYNEEKICSEFSSSVLEKKLEKRLSIYNMEETFAFLKTYCLMKKQNAIEAGYQWIRTKFESETPERRRQKLEELIDDPNSEFVDYDFLIMLRKVYKKSMPKNRELDINNLNEYDPFDDRATINISEAVLSSLIDTIIAIDDRIDDFKISLKNIVNAVMTTMNTGLSERRRDTRSQLHVKKDSSDNAPTDDNKPAVKKQAQKSGCFAAPTSCVIF